MARSDHAPCPYHVDALPLRVVGGQYGDRRRQVVCGCGARGPLAANEALAWRAWDHRPVADPEPEQGVLFR